ncbi:hypothetical protein RCZ04_18800 [Capnocytophaga sp. HP1101]
MARIEENFAMSGMSGKLGNLLVYRQRNGKTIVAKTPHRTAKKSEKQVETNNRFKLASTYAKNALLDPALKALYEAEAKKRAVSSAYNMAMADYLKPPIVSKIDASAYTGAKAGEKIIIEADDKFKVTSLKVTINDSDNTLVEEGTAKLSGGKWVYTTSVVNASLSGDKIIVTATDHPGNVTTKEITL